MKPEFKSLRDEINQIEIKLKDKTELLETLEKECSHVWGESQYNPMRRKDITLYHSITGSFVIGEHDHVPPEFVEIVTVDRWSRTCEVCGKTEYTEKFNKETTIVKNPIWK